LNAFQEHEDSKLDAQNLEIRVLRWVIVVEVAIIAASGFFG